MEHRLRNQRIGRVMDEERGNKRVAALRLGLSRRRLSRRRLHLYNLPLEVR